MAALNEARASGEGKVTFVDLSIGQDRFRFQLRVNEICDEPALNAFGPMELYQRVVTGKGTPREIAGVIRAGLKGAQRGQAEPVKVGPIVDRIMDDYPFATGVAMAETILAAYLVGIDPPAEA